MAQRDLPESKESGATSEDDLVALISANQQRLRAYLLAMVRSTKDMEDILQETNLALWRSRARYDPSRPFAAWAVGVALREVKAYQRKAARDRLWFNEPLLDRLTAEFATSTAFEQERCDALADCVGKLELTDRRLLDSRYRDETPIKEIAARDRIPEKTVYWRLSRIRNQLHDCVERSLRLQGHC